MNKQGAGLPVLVAVAKLAVHSATPREQFAIHCGETTTVGAHSQGNYERVAKVHSSHQ
jgi:hypothetical protein